MNCMKLDWTRWSRLIVAAVGLAVFLALGFSGRALAVEVVTGDPDATVAEDVIIDDDLFVTGDHVVVDGTVTGDLFASGMDLVVNGAVHGNVFMGGKALTVNGTVGGSLFGGGCALTLGPDARIDHNVYYGGFSLMAEEGSRVGRNIYAGDFQTKLNGEVGHNVDVDTGAFELNGPVGGNMHVDLGETCPTCASFVAVTPLQAGLRMGDDAAVEGDTTYTVSTDDFAGPETSNVDMELLALNTDADEGAAGFAIPDWVRRAIGEFVSLLIIGILLLYFVPGRVQSVTDKILGRPLSSIGWGLLVVLLFPLALLLAVALLAAVTVLLGLFTWGQLSGIVLGLGGLSIASIVAVFAFVLYLVTKVIFAYLVGRLVLAWLSSATLEGRWANVWALVVGALLYEIVRTIPLLGVLVAVVVILIGIGAIFSMLLETARPTAAAA